MRNDERAALAAASTMLAEPVEETEPVAEQETPEGEVPQGTEEVVEETEEEEPFFPDFSPELPEGLEEELSAPTSEQILESLEQEEEYQLLDEDSQRLMARARAAEARATHLEGLRVQEARKGWEEEATKFFPLSETFLSEIHADSRRGFLREAKARHDAILPLLKPLKEKAEKEIAAMRATVEAEEREAAEKRWGAKPAATEVPTEASITQDEIVRNRAKGDLSSTLKAMMFPKKREE